MVPHTDYQNGAAVDVPSAEPVLSRLVDLLDDRLISRDLVRPVVLVPLDPLAPLLDGLLPVEFSSDREPRDRVDVGVEMLSLFAVLVLFQEDLLDLVLVGLNLGEFAVCYS